MSSNTNLTWNIPKTIIFFSHNLFALAFAFALWLWAFDKLELDGLLFVASLMALTIAVWVPIVGSAIIALISFDYPGLPFNAALLAFLPVIIIFVIATLYHSRIITED
ncbi:hypothetical protein [Vibrio sp. 1180_3]|uniref:hypothetical protein n=1 Tax=Vibrio sp. 1180_3 TaxID=2528832 RepID=UPI0024057FD2|nr:hypothetical protein [Vibrio sp. 1180_3]MDF9399064.1 hypothetical protein [Vibrio sp. 1180_3]